MKLFPKDLNRYFSPILIETQFSVFPDVALVLHNPRTQKSVFKDCRKGLVSTVLVPPEVGQLQFCLRFALRHS